jgi:hypothetical protein
MSTSEQVDTAKKGPVADMMSALLAAFPGLWSHNCDVRRYFPTPKPSCAPG